MLRLQCGTENIARIRQSRLAVLKTSSKLYDYGLTTGHGVPEDRPCIVRDFDGRYAAIDVITYAQNYKSGTRTDWAILRFEKITTPNLVRYDINSVQTDISIDGMEINFARAKGLPDNKQKCHLEILSFSNNNQKISHSCRSFNGQSGTPVTKIINNQEKLIGLHVGQLWMHTSPVTGKPDRKGYINLLDEEMVAEIKDIIRQNS